MKIYPLSSTGKHYILFITLLKNYTTHKKLGKRLFILQNCINKNLETPERGCSVQPHFRSLRNYSSTLSCSTLVALGGLCLAQAARLSIPQVCFPVFFTKHFLSLSAGSSSLSNYSIHPPSYGQLLAPSQVHGSQSVPTLCHSLCLQNILIYVTFLTRTGFENSFCRDVQSQYLCGCWKSSAVPEKWQYKLHNCWQPLRGHCAG